ncbi:MAG: prolipoprotein diacylglyceryl transferase [Nanoarchaeota archaeon]
MWIDNLNPIALQLGPLSIHWYGVMYVLGFLFTWYYLRQRVREGKLSLTEQDVENALVWLVLGVVVGGRLGEVLFYRPMYYLANPFKIIAIWEGGLSFHGGLIACLIAGYFFAKKKKMPFLAFADAFVVPLAIVQAFGRIGNFINGELYGRITSVPWAMIFPLAGDMLPRHPSQLYEVGYNLLIGAVIFSQRDKKRPHGWLLGFWFVLYAIARFTNEFFREPEVLLGPLTMGQMLSAPMLFIGLWLMFRKDATRYASTISSS